MKRALGIGLGVICGLAPLAAADGPFVTDFETGPHGWSVNTWDTVEFSGGNPGGHLHYVNPDTWGINVFTNTARDYIRDYRAFGPCRLSIDFDVETINILGMDVRRSLVLELRDYDNPPPNYPYTSVWFEGDLLPEPADGWQTLSFDITNVDDSALPPGWGGYGDEDPVTFEPRLPANRNWADMLASVDEVHFTTFVPGYFYAFTTFDIRVDNIVLESLGGPACNPDYNQDGGGDNADVTDLANDIASGSQSYPPNSPDFNSDGGADNSDITDLANVIAGGPCP